MRLTCARLHSSANIARDEARARVRAGISWGRDAWVRRRSRRTARARPVHGHPDLGPRSPRAGPTGPDGTARAACGARSSQCADRRGLSPASAVRPRALSSSRNASNPASEVTVAPWNSCFRRRSKSSRRPPFSLSPVASPIRATPSILANPFRRRHVGAHRPRRGPAPGRIPAIGLTGRPGCWPPTRSEIGRVARAGRRWRRGACRRVGCRSRRRRGRRR